MTKPRGEVIFDAEQVDRTIDRLTAEIVESKPEFNQFCLVGIRTGGAILAQEIKNRLDKILKTDVSYGVIDINLYRDDWSQATKRPQVGRTEIDFSIDNKDIILVDDVLYTGRTIRAAMDALMDFGRPQRVELLVMVDRGHRELPICANFIGRVIETDHADQVNVHLDEDEADAITLIKGAA